MASSELFVDFVGGGCSTLSGCRSVKSLFSSTNLHFCLSFKKVLLCARSCLNSGAVGLNGTIAISLTCCFFL